MAAARAELVNLPRRLPREMIADPPTDTRRPAIISSFWRDIRHALRLLRTRPGFAAVAVTTLALGIGANTAIFSVVRSVLLEPIPFPDPDRLVLLWEAPADSPTKTFIVSAPNYVDWRRDVKSFEQSGIWEFLTFNLSGDGEPERVSGMRVSSSTFAMLGVPPALGRTFTADEDQPGHDVAIISEGLWRRRFGASPDIVGRTARVNGRPFQIVGVMPESFRFTQSDTSLWIPIAFNAGDADRGAHSFYAAARLRDGVTVTEARAEMDALAAGRWPNNIQMRTKGKPPP